MSGLSLSLVHKNAVAFPLQWSDSPHLHLSPSSSPIPASKKEDKGETVSCSPFVVKHAFIAAVICQIAAGDVELEIIKAHKQRKSCDSVAHGSSRRHQLSPESGWRGLLQRCGLPCSGLLIHPGFCPSVVSALTMMPRARCHSVWQRGIPGFGVKARDCVGLAK